MITRDLVRRLERLEEYLAPPSDEPALIIHLTGVGHPDRIIEVRLFSKCSQRGCVSGSIFAFGVVQFLIGRLATIRKTDWIR